MAYINTVESENIQAGLAAAPPSATVDIWPSLDPTKPFSLQTTGINNFIAQTNQIGVNYNFGLTDSFGADLTFGISNAFGIDGAFGGKVDAQPFFNTSSPTIDYSSPSGDLFGYWQYNGVFISTGPHTGSDVRLKNNIKPLNAKECLDKVMKFTPVEFDWREEVPNGIAKNKHEIGLIAQEVNNIVPEVVVEAVNPYNIIQQDGSLLENILEIDYGKLSALLIAAMQEQQNKINSLERTVQELSTRLETC